MKRVAIALLAGVAAVAGLGYSASAADLAVKAAPAPLPSWTGFYIGVHGGAAWQSGKADWSWTDPNFGAIAGAVPSPLGLGQNTNQLGAVAGLQVGYNWQFAPVWVAGVEGDFSWSSLSDHRTLSPAVVPGVAGAGGPANGAANFGATSIQMSANTEWLASVRAKLGFTGWFNNTMLYVTGGGAMIDTEYNGQGIFFNGFRDDVSSNRVKGGWVAGAGAEWMATTNILLRAEYLYYGFNNNVTAPAPYFPAFGANAPTFGWGSYNVQVFRVAGSYKF
jgi:outer membrane immunogenic protein